jgi:hypothetical protein
LPPTPDSATNSGLMLLQFVVENFRSFRDKAVLSLVAAEGASAPQHVLARLDAFASRYRLVDGLDELWVVIDVDRWPREIGSHVHRLVDRLLRRE